MTHPVYETNSQSDTINHCLAPVPLSNTQQRVPNIFSNTEKSTVRVIVDGGGGGRVGVGGVGGGRGGGIVPRNSAIIILGTITMARRRKRLRPEILTGSIFHCCSSVQACSKSYDKVLHMDCVV